MGNVRAHLADGRVGAVKLGRAVQIDPIKSTLKPPGTKRFETK
jgi:hypothetical protein